MKNLFNSALAAYGFHSPRPSYKTTKWLQTGNAKSKKCEIASTRPKGTRIKWTEEQKLVSDAVERGKNVFCTGPAGTGKTFLLKHIIKKLQEMYSKSTVYVTATTGVAACAIDGQTLHSFAGTGIVCYEDRERLLQRVMSDKKAVKRWLSVEALVIDECSMIDGEFLDNLEFIASSIRKERVPNADKIWGGIKLFVTGDFLQLPPIINKGRKSAKVFAFEADCWNASFDLQIELTEIFRQSEPELIRLLQAVRKGKTDPEDLQILEKCCLASEPDPSAVKLFPRIEDVDRVNRKELLSLNKSIVVYKALDSGKDPWRRQLNRGIAPEWLELCLGARVMLNKNLDTDRKLVNGASGTITNFVLNHTSKGKHDKDIIGVSVHRNYLPLVKFDCGLERVIGLETWAVMDGEKVVAKRKQIPLILAWALSVHKCQGMSLDRVHTDLRRAFGFGMVYVALSRVVKLAGLHLSGFDPSKIKAHPKALQFCEKLSIKKDEHAIALDNDLCSSNNLDDQLISR